MTQSRLIRFTLLLLVLMMVLIGCRQEEAPADNPDINVEMRVEPDPPVVGDSTLYVTVTDAQGNPINDANVMVRGDMSHAGMVPVMRDVQAGAQGGVYEIPFEWTMGGDWFVDVTVLTAGGDSRQVRFEYTLPGDPTMGDMDMNDDDTTNSE